MKLIILAFLLSIFGWSTLAQAEKPKLENLNWIAGCWRSNEKGSVSAERWTKPSGKMMLGTSQMVKNGKTLSFEFLRIVQTENGIFYISKPSENNAETSFKLIKFTKNQVIFENPEHDFPQRIIYRWKKNKSLLARIEGKNNGREWGIDFSMNRTKCE